MAQLVASISGVVVGGVVEVVARIINSIYRLLVYSISLYLSTV